MNQRSVAKLRRPVVMEAGGEKDALRHLPTGQAAGVGSPAGDEYVFLRICNLTLCQSLRVNI